MSEIQDDNLEQMLEAHLDGRRDADSSAPLVQDAAFELLAEQQRRIDAALRRIARPGDPSAILARVEAAVRDGRVIALRRAQRQLRIVRMAVAAVVVLAVGGGGWLAWVHWGGASTNGERNYGEHPWKNFEMVYRDEVGSGFKVDWVCKDDKEFAGTFFKRFGQGLLLAQLPTDVQSLGLSYCNTLSRKTVILLTLVHGEKVIVFIDRPGQYQDSELAGNSNLHIFRREVGKLVLYEVTPLDKPYVLDSFYDPQKSADWYGGK